MPKDTKKSPDNFEDAVDLMLKSFRLPTIYRDVILNHFDSEEKRSALMSQMTASGNSFDQLPGEIKDVLTKNINEFLGIVEADILERNDTESLETLGDLGPDRVVISKLEADELIALLCQPKVSTRKNCFYRFSGKISSENRNPDAANNAS